MRVMSAARELNDLQRAAQIHVEAAFLRFAVERGGAMQHRVRGRDQQVVLLVIEPEARRGQIAAENAYACREMFVKNGKVEVQLQRAPQAALRLLDVFRANQHIERFAMLFEKPRRQIGSDVSGCAGEKYSHVAQAPLGSICDGPSAASGRRNSRRGALSSACPSISG